MLKKVKIKNLPKAAKGGVSYNQLAPMYMPNNMGFEGTKVRDTLQPIPRDQANLEAEKGETALLPNVGGLPAHYKIGGSRHSAGGTPLNLPDESFIFSDTKAMTIRDPKILAEFGETKPKTPAKIAKKYDINKYREILADPDMDQRSKETAEQMIANYNLKLAKLALYQESTKGFEGGIPTAALPFMAVNNIQPQDILPIKTQETPEEEMDEDDMYEEENPDEEEYVDEETLPEAQFGGGRLGRRIRDFFRGSRQFDPTTGIYMNTDPQGRVYYVDGRGVPLPNNIQLPQGFMMPGTVVNTPSGTTKVSGKTGTTQTKTIKVDRKIPEGATVIKRSDYKTDQEYRKARDKAFKDAKNKGNVYATDANGKSYRVVSKAFIAPEYKGKDADKVFKGNKDVANTYQYIEDRLLGNTDLQEKLYEATVKELKDPNSQRVKALKSRGVDVNKMIEGLTPESVSKQFLDMQKRNIALGVHHGKVAKTPNNPEDLQKGVSNKELEKAAEAAGIPMPSASDAALQQAAYRAMNNLAELGEADGFIPGQVGAADEPGKNKKISPIDGIYTNTTAGEIIGVPGVNIAEEDLGQDEIADEISTNDLEVTDVQRPDAEWWLQDAIATAGAAGDLARIKKYTPWAPKLSPYIPEPTFYDPTRELANMTEQLAIGTEGSGAFAPAQSYNARFAEMQAQGAKSAADILGRYNNLNVGAANQFELTKANMFNQTGMANAEIAGRLYDQNTIANQQYDNAKNQARQQLRQSYINAITNRAMTQAMNETYGDHYMVDPSSGGFVQFTGKTADLQPSNPYSQEKAAAFRNLKDRFPDVDDNILLRLMTGETDKNYADDYMKTLASMYPAQTGAGYGQYYQQG
jgi:hypothetical protein